MSEENKITLTIQLKNMTDMVVAHLKTITKLAEELKAIKTNNEYLNSINKNLKYEIDSIHGFLDVLPHSMPRTTVPDLNMPWKTITHLVLTRLSYYLALR